MNEDFENFLKNTGMKSASKYVGGLITINNKVKNKVIQKDIMEMNLDEFMAHLELIKNDNAIIAINTTGNGMYYTSLNWFKFFLMSKSPDLKEVYCTNGNGADGHGLLIEDFDDKKRKLFVLIKKGSKIASTETESFHTRKVDEKRQVLVDAEVIDMDKRTFEKDSFLPISKAENMITGGHTAGYNWKYKDTDEAVIERPKKSKKEKDTGSNNESENNNEDNAESDLIKGTNVIYYGVPGCGKSYAIENDYGTNDDTIRTVFHPDYTNTDFVGQIIPKTIPADDKKNVKQLSYEFNPGPFTLALENAYTQEDQNHVLIIEEINRGNAAAIFGDIFQLLDRNDYGSSIYFINNHDVVEYLQEHLKTTYDTCLEDERSSCFRELMEQGRLRIPSNLILVATMNTSDQNVYTLDTAFKRRWEMKRIKNDFDTEDKKQQEFFKKPICGAVNKNGEAILTWKEFATSVNKYLVDNKTFLSNDDKRLGTNFVSAEELQDKEKFGEKVLMYIWNDIAKMKPDDWFNLKKVKSFDDMLDKFIDGNEKDPENPDFTIFSEKFLDELQTHKNFLEYYKPNGNANENNDGNSTEEK